MQKCCRNCNCQKKSSCNCGKAEKLPTKELLFQLFMCHQMAMEREAQQKQSRKVRTPPSPTTDSVQCPFRNNVKQSSVPIIWVLGGPGSGKGTQCDKIVAKYHFSHFSTGDLLRAEVASGSDKGKQLLEIMTKGDLVPNEEVLGLLERAMAKVVATSVGYLVDGYPREKSQGTAFEEYIAPVDLVLYFECSDETMVSRIMHRAAQSAEVRADDNEATIKSRLTTFKNNTEAILQQYPVQVRRINGERAVDDIFADVAKYIDEMLVAKQKAVAVSAS